MTSKSRFYTRKESGFSLVELAMVMLISGIILMMFVQFFQLYMAQYRQSVAKDNMELTQSALREFYGLMGRYPCPANPDLGPADANYGREQCRTAVTDDCVVGVPAGIACTVNGSRDADVDGAPDVVMIGGLPFRDLMDVAEGTRFLLINADDGMNMQFTYAVSEKMTENIYSAADPVSYYFGAIRVIDENQIDVLDPPSSAHYVLVSHGINQDGGYTLQGERFSPCLTGLQSNPLLDAPPVPGLNGAGIAPEKENCDANDGIYLTSFQSLVPGANYYDDRIVYASSGLQSHWEMSVATAEDTIHNTNLGNVGVGVTNPTAKFHVSDNLAAQRQMGAMRYCNDGPDSDGDGINEEVSGSGSNCLDPNIIAGAGIQCPNPGEAAVGIENNQIICQQVFSGLPPGFAGVSCPSGQYMVAISNMMNVRCAPL